MLYQVSRNGQMYGPYTMDELTRYVGTGNVQLTDLAKAEDSAEWIPVSQLIGAAGAPPVEPPLAAYHAPTGGYPPAGAAPAYAGVYGSPPGVNGGLVLLFSILTCTLFMWVWNLILAAWANRIAPASKILVYYIAATVMLVIQASSGAHANVSHGNFYHYNHMAHTGFYGTVSLVCWVVRLIARFNMRNVLEQHYNTVEPVGLRLSGVMTFFFGGVYFQYHLNRINDMKRMMSYRTAGLS
jgi:hypothetical protein